MVPQTHVAPVHTPFGSQVVLTRLVSLGHRHNQPPPTRRMRQKEQSVKWEPPTALCVLEVVRLVLVVVDARVGVGDVRVIAPALDEERQLRNDTVTALCAQHQPPSSDEAQRSSRPGQGTQRTRPLFKRRLAVNLSRSAFCGLCTVGSDGRALNPRFSDGCGTRGGPSSGGRHPVRTHSWSG